MLPNFLIIGAMKSGTGSLWEYLRHHPQIFMSVPKELDFFAEELNWGRGPAWYEEHFAEADGALAVGEASTSYSKAPLYAGVPARIVALLPNVRVVYLLRHPIERMRSQYLHEVLNGRERRPVEEALRDPTYLDFSRYAFQIAQYLPHVPRERMLVVLSEQLREDRERALQRVCSFLGLSASWTDPVAGREFHRTEEKRALRPAFRALHRVPGYRAVAGLVPEKVKTATERFRTRGISPDRSRISDGLRRDLERRLRDDVHRLHGYVGPEFDGWGIG